MFKLEILDNYYRKNRQVGHTTAMLNGAKSNKNILVVVASEIQKGYLDLPKEQMINMHNLHEKLLGRNNPILVEHYAMQLMYEEMKKELNKKNECIEELEYKVKMYEQN